MRGILPPRFQGRKPSQSQERFGNTGPAQYLYHHFIFEEIP